MGGPENIVQRSRFQPEDEQTLPPTSVTMLEEIFGETELPNQLDLGALYTDYVPSDDPSVGIETEEALASLSEERTKIEGELDKLAEQQRTLEERLSLIRSAQAKIAINDSSLPETITEE